MTNKTSKERGQREFGAVLQDLLNRARQGASELLGLLNPAPRPALQPVPVRNQNRRARRAISSR